MKMEKNDQLVMIGDSITDCGRDRPVGERNGIGIGYPRFVSALLDAVYPEQSIRTINMGISGDTVRSLQARWQSDVIDLQPDWLSIMIGINDVWRQYDHPKAKEIHISIAEYEQTLRELIDAVLPRLKGLVLMTPFFIEPNKQEPMRQTMDEYGQVVAKLAKEKNAHFVDVQAAFDHFSKHIYPGEIAADRIHPNATGHMVIARAFLNAIGFDWSRC